MSIDLTIFAPGCFGGALFHNANAPECKKCPFNEPCGVEALDRRAKFKAELLESNVAGPRKVAKGKDRQPRRARERSCQSFADRVRRMVSEAKASKLAEGEERHGTSESTAANPSFAVLAGC